MSESRCDTTCGEGNRCAHSESCGNGGVGDCPAVATLRAQVGELKAALAEAQDKNGLAWTDGEPPHPWKEEWFIAETAWGDRVVLKALPEEYSYDYTTADGTYIKADKIKRWMQFPATDYISFAVDRATRAEAELAEIPHLRNDITTLRDEGARAIIALEVERDEAQEQNERVMRWAKGRCETCAYMKMEVADRYRAACGECENGTNWKPAWEVECR